MKPYYEDDFATIYHGDCREVTEWLGADVLVTDPPYGETSLSWDKWPTGWPGLASTSPNLRQIWCFGSMRMFLENGGDFAEWRLAQDLVWTKPRGRSSATDRFQRSHELLLHWYRGAWGDLPHDVPRVPSGKALVKATRRANDDDGTRVRGGSGASVYVDDGMRMMTTVIPGDAGDPRVTLHPTQKPMELLRPIISYSCLSSAVVADPFMGSGTTLRAAKDLGRRSIGIEVNERYCEIAAKRLGQEVLDFGGAV